MTNVQAFHIHGDFLNINSILLTRDSAKCLENMLCINDVPLSNPLRG